MPARNFFWYELMTTDMDAAERFYRAVVGWDAQPFPGAMPYTVVKAGERGVGGIMGIPEGAGLNPAWVGYIRADDVDAETENVREAGGAVHRPPADIPDVGRFSVVADPQGALFMLLQPKGEEQPPVALGTPGHVGWHELHAADWRGAFDFYASQFGWEKGEAMDMGGMGTYQLFTVGGQLVGAMFDKPAEIPVPTWLFYFNVDDIDAARRRVTDNGGTIMLEPMEVPDGWVLQAADPQGAWFALTGPKG